MPAPVSVTVTDSRAVTVTVTVTGTFGANPLPRKVARRAAIVFCASLDAGDAIGKRAMSRTGTSSLS